MIAQFVQCLSGASPFVLFAGMWIERRKVMNQRPGADRKVCAVAGTAKVLDARQVLVHALHQAVNHACTEPVEVLLVRIAKGKR